MVIETTSKMVNVRAVKRTLFLTALPSAPRNLHVKKAGKDFITVAWDVPETDGLCGITYYTVEKKDITRLAVFGILTHSLSEMWHLYVKANWYRLMFATFRSVRVIELQQMFILYRDWLNRVVCFQFALSSLLSHLY